MQKEKVYFENLDALRFFAFLIVFISHISIFLGFNPKNFEAMRLLFLTHGDLGVSFFFVLSGFLITFLLLSEKSKGDISLPHFYLRRILRIWPLYFLILIIGFFIIPKVIFTALPFSIATESIHLPLYILFTSNFIMSSGIITSVVLGVLWSISIEEQFYLIWPLIIKKVKFNYLKYLLFIIISISTIYRLFYAESYDVLHYSTLSVFSDLAIGALGAVLVNTSTKFVDRIKNIPKNYILYPYIFLLLLIPFSKTIYVGLLGYPLFYIIKALFPLIFATLFLYIILEQTYAINSFWKLGKNKILTYLGKISYGLYVYHVIGFLITLKILEFINIPIFSNSVIYYLIKIICSFILTILIATISYEYFEVHFVKLKNKFGYRKLL